MSTFNRQLSKKENERMSGIQRLLFQFWWQKKNTYQLMETAFMVIKISNFSLDIIFTDRSLF